MAINPAYHPGPSGSPEHLTNRTRTQLESRQLHLVREAPLVNPVEFWSRLTPAQKVLFALVLTTVAASGGYLALQGLNSQNALTSGPQGPEIGPSPVPSATPTLEPSPTPTATLKPTEIRPATLTATPTKARETETKAAPTKTVVKPSPTPVRPTEAPRLAQVNGKSLHESTPIEENQNYTIKPGEALYFIIGAKDQNKIQMGINIVSAPAISNLADKEAFSFQVFDDQNFNQLLEFEKGRTEMPHDKGYGSPNRSLGMDRYFDGGHGEGLAWVARFFNKTAAPITFRAGILTRRSGDCNSGNSGAYWEYIRSVLTYWKTCDQNWLGSNTKK